MTHNQVVPGSSPGGTTKKAFQAIERLFILNLRFVLETLTTLFLINLN